MLWYLILYQWILFFRVVNWLNIYLILCWWFSLDIFIFQTLKHVKLILISSHKVRLRGIPDMTVMRETGLIVVMGMNGTLFQLSLQEGHLIKDQIEHMCPHSYVCLLCVQVAEHEYLARSCWECKNIKLMNLNKQMGRSLETQLMQYEVITALSDKRVRCMCHGEGNRIFVRSSGGVL